MAIGSHRHHMNERGRWPGQGLAMVKAEEGGIPAQVRGSFRLTGPHVPLPCPPPRLPARGQLWEGRTAWTSSQAAWQTLGLLCRRL